MKWKKLHIKEKESWELSAGSLWRIASQILSRRSWWQHRIFSVMVFPLLAHVLLGPGVCPQWEVLLLVQQINFLLLIKLLGSYLGRSLVTKTSKGQSRDCVGGFLCAHVLKALVVSVIWPTRKFLEAENMSRFTSGLMMSKDRNGCVWKNENIAYRCWRMHSVHIDRKGSFYRIKILFSPVGQSRMDVEFLSE